MAGPGMEGCVPYKPGRRDFKRIWNCSGKHLRPLGRRDLWAQLLVSDTDELVYVAKNEQPIPGFGISVKKEE